MGQVASQSQLRAAYARWALVCVPTLLFLGFLSGRVSSAGTGNAWYDALVKPAFMPPGWAFGAAWSILFTLEGLALALILNARGARGRTAAIAVFATQFALSLAWSPLFFAWHQVLPALVLILAMLIIAIGATMMFTRIRRPAAWLMAPYLAWLGFAAALNYETDRLNPGASALVPQHHSTQIQL